MRRLAPAVEWQTDVNPHHRLASAEGDTDLPLHITVKLGLAPTAIQQNAGCRHARGRWPAGPAPVLHLHACTPSCGYAGNSVGSSWATCASDVASEAASFSARSPRDRQRAELTSL